jgi:hypothetical protein
MLIARSRWKRALRLRFGSEIESAGQFVASIQILSPSIYQLGCIDIQIR